MADGLTAGQRLPELLALTEVLAPHLAGGAQRLAEAMAEAETVDRLLDGAGDSATRSGSRVERLA